MRRIDSPRKPGGTSGVSARSAFPCSSASAVPPSTDSTSSMCVWGLSSEGVDEMKITTIVFSASLAVVGLTAPALAQSPADQQPQAQIVARNAAGHATMLTGAYPQRTGIIGNDWRDRDSGETLYCTGDWDEDRQREHANAVTLLRP